MPENDNPIIVIDENTEEIIGYNTEAQLAAILTGHSYKKKNNNPNTGIFELSPI